MEIFTLGTGSCEINPARFNSSVLVECENGLYLFDAGQPVDALICRAGKDVSLLKGVFVSHMHADHVAGLACLIRAICMNPNPRGKVKIFLPEAEAIEPLCCWMRAMRIGGFEAYVELLSMEEGSVYTDDWVYVRAVPTDHIHGDRPLTYAYILEAEGKRLLYTGDLTADLHDYPACAFSEEFDVCVMEATHYQPNVLLPLLERTHVKKLIFVHVHTHYGASQNGTLCHPDKLMEMIRLLPFPAFLSQDGSRYHI